jgi:hypothetical protein
VPTPSDVRIYVDTCPDVLRVRLVEQGRPATPPEPACARTEIPALFVMAAVTTFVVDLDGRNAVVHLRQGPAPDEWIRRGEGPDKKFVWGTPRTVFVLSGGAGFANFSDAALVSCGTVSACSARDFRPVFTAAAMYWIKPYIAAQVSYMKPMDATTTGSSDTFRFDSSLDTRIVTIAGNAGGAVGPVRIYGQGGFNHHQATLATTETINDRSVVVNDVTQTIQGGTQAFELKTAGWGWMFGGGLEGWLKRPIAFYVEGQYLQLKGKAVGGVEGEMDDKAFIIHAGVRVRIGR